MTIKEVELQTGLARANIRYYEDQGFFSPARGENGYRDYSEEDVNTLLKLKLLRQLGFSLEEIHELQKGERSLEPALERRESALEGERRELARAAQLCRDMRSDGVSFYTLDARRYLDRLAREEAVLEQDRDPVRIFPWRRFFARTLDLSIYTTLVTVILQLTAHMNFIRTGTLLTSLLGLVLMTGAEILMLHLWGTTPSKALLGLKILRGDGSRLDLGEAALRTVQVMVFFGGSMLLAKIPVPIFALISLGMDVWACWQVYHENPLFWESYDQLYLEGSTRLQTFWERKRSWTRVAGYLAVCAACVGLTVAGHFLAAMPPHRGADITAEQFVENYNRYIAFVHGGVSRRLTVSGKFEDLPLAEGTVIINVMENEEMPDPAFQFDSGDGPVERVTLVRTYESEKAPGDGNVYMVSIPYEEIYTAMRSLLYGRLGGRTVNALYEELVEANGNLHKDLYGVRIDSEMRFSGYHSFDDSTLLAQTQQRQSYFVEFTMALTE